MSMCTGTSDNSPACGACKTAFSETIASIKYQQQHSYGSGNYGYGYSEWDAEQRGSAGCLQSLRPW